MNHQCPYCQQPTREGSRFCSQCGQSLGDLNAPAPPAESPAAEPIEVVEIGDLIEVRESVVFDEISFEAAESPEIDPDAGGRPPVA